MTTTLQGIVRGSRRAKIQDGDILKREFIETYIVTSDDGTDDEGHVYATTGLPVIGDAWTGQGGSTNPGTYVVSVTISDHDATKKRWEVEVEYSSELPDNGSNTSGGGTNPLNFDPEIEWETELVEKVATRDRIGGAIVNKVGDPAIYPPVMRLVPQIRLRYTKWQTSYSVATAIVLSGTVNSDHFLGFPPGVGFMGPISARSEFVYGLQYWRVTYPVMFRIDDRNPDKAWFGKTFNVGPNYFLNPPFNVKSAITELGKPLVNLTSSGGLAPDGAAAEELEFDLYRTTPFSVIL